MTTPSSSRGPGTRAPGRSAAPAAELHRVGYRYPGAGEDALTDVRLSFLSGDHSAILGPNGAGKSTLLRLLTGLLEPRTGTVRLWGRRLSSWSRRELARNVGVVSQEAPPGFPMGVREFVEMGRNPYVRPWESLDERDRRAAAEALRRTDMDGLADRRISELSGGELQRAKLARALAQEPRLLLLDEPTAHLDLGHEMQFFHLVRKLVASGRVTAITVTHNLHLASRYADVLVLLSRGRVEATGPAERVVRADTLERVFGWPVRVADLGRLGLGVVPLDPDPGDG